MKIFTTAKAYQENTTLKADVLRLSELKPGLVYHPWNSDPVILPHYFRDKTHKQLLYVKNNVISMMVICKY